MVNRAELIAEIDEKIAKLERHKKSLEAGAVIVTIRSQTDDEITDEQVAKVREILADYGMAFSVIDR